jgi:peptide/nickel transport system substrate-binding protein
MRKLRSFFPLAATAAAALVVAGCGGGGGGGGTTAGGASTTGKKGGSLTVLNVAGGVDSLDPGYWYYQEDYAEIGLTTQRWLYSWQPGKTTPTPDIADGMPQLSNGGKTVTIKLKTGIKYSAPLQNREVSSKDIKYAMSRAFTPRVGSGYAPVYYGDIKGVAAVQSGKAKLISGIQTPDDHTLVFQLTKPVGVIANAQALALPATVPVPQDYAAKYDKGATSKYGEHQVFTGPYMIQNDGKGNITGYQPGKKLVIVRNPSWNSSNDFRPAYLDQISFLCCSDVTVASRKTLTGQSLASGDYAAPPTAVLKQALSSRKQQVSNTPSQGNRFIALNSKVKPFDNINVRRAVAAVTDRNALRLTRGGPAIGVIATHFLPPGIPGFEEAGGEKSSFDFYNNPNGDLNLAMQYMKKAGYSSGKYTGSPLLMVGDNQPPASKTGEAFQSQLQKLGFKLNYRQVPHATMLSKFCGVPKAAVAICPNLGWGKDFYDPQSFMDPVFNGKNIAPQNNSNYAQLNDPKINALLDKAVSTTDETQRAKLYGEIDKTITSGAYVITWLWDNQVRLESTNVKGVLNDFNSTWDYNFTSLK